MIAIKGEIAMMTPKRSATPQRMSATTANVGAASEALVTSRLLSLGVDVARPASDNGVDLFAFGGPPWWVVPLQVKSASTERITVRREWFKVPGLILVFVWLREGRCFVFDGIADVEAFLGPSASTSSWRERGDWAVTTAGPSHRERLAPFEEAWGKVLDRAPMGAVARSPHPTPTSARRRADRPSPSRGG
jgi:hypothetical protein